MKDEEIKKLVFIHYSNCSKPKCKKCSFDNINALCLDHVNSDGNIHRKNGGKKGINLYKQLYKHNFNSKYKFQVLCANCNMIKVFENKENSHIKNDTWKNNISKSLKGINRIKGKNSSRAKRVAQYDLNNNLIKIWDFIKEAELYYNKNINAKNIVACCNNKQNTAYGYIWKHYNN